MKINTNQLADALNDFVAINNLANNPHFEVFGQETQGSQPVNHIFADKSTGLLARLRPKDEIEINLLKTNLEFVAQAIEAGAPLVPPISHQVYDLANCWATFWRLGNNRLVTASEMAETLYKIHQTPRFNRLTSPENMYLSKSNETQVPANLPKRLSTEINCYSRQVLSDLLKLYKKAPDKLIHGDSHPSNFVELESKIAACDTDKITSGPIEIDFVLPCLHARYYPQADRQMGQKLIQAYPGQINLELLEALIKFKVIRRLFAANDNQEIFEQRWQSILTNRPFTKLIGPESHTYFADTLK